MLWPNGNLLLNIGPKADGTIPEQDQDILTDRGLAGVNGEAIYQESALAGVIEAQEGSFRRASATLYQPRFPLYHAWRPALCHPAGTKWRGKKSSTLPSLAYDLKQPRILHARIQKVELLRKSAPLSQDETGLHLQLPVCNNRVFAPQLLFSWKFSIRNRLDFSCIL